MRGEAFDLYSTFLLNFGGKPGSGFDDLIQLFNEMTPHLPYTWEMDGGIYNRATRRQGGIPEGSSAVPTDEGHEPKRRVPRRRRSKSATGPD